jgi:hypothetical protein
MIRFLYHGELLAGSSFFSVILILYQISAFAVTILEYPNVRLDYCDRIPHCFMQPDPVLQGDEYNILPMRIQIT